MAPDDPGDRPTLTEPQRAARAIALGAVLGAVLAFLARRRQRPARER
jgi:hypothetical protein